MSERWLVAACGQPVDTCGYQVQHLADGYVVVGRVKTVVGGLAIAWEVCRTALWRVPDTSPPMFTKIRAQLRRIREGRAPVHVEELLSYAVVTREEGFP